MRVNCRKYMTQHLPRLARIVLLLGSVVLPQGSPLAAMAGALDIGDAPDSKLSRIKDVASVEGVRDNQLIGYGLVVGLRNSGDSQQTGFSVQTLLATLQRMGVNMGATNTNAIRVQNTAAV